MRNLSGTHQAPLSKAVDFGSPHHSPTYHDEFTAPAQVGSHVATDAAKKAEFRQGQLLLRAFLCTPFLGFAVALTAHLTSQGVPAGVAGLVFPVGYVMLWILGLEMATGSFSVMPIGFYARTVRLGALARNWILTYAGNLAGGVFFAALLWFSLTKGGAQEPTGLVSVISGIAEKKLSYHHYGAAGWCAAIGMGILCNWMVSLAPILAKAARTMTAKIILIWLPLATFFSIGFEHAIVNMFVFPLALMSGADFSISDWWLWNQIPVTLGNILGAVIFNSTLWYKSHAG